MTQSLKFFKDGRSYEERTYCPMMDGMGYITDLLNAQERPQHVSMRPTNKMFDKFYKAHQPSKKTKLNKLMNDTLKTSSPQFYVEQQFNTTGMDSSNGRYEFKLDPNFMSCNSVYKTLALRGIYMKPKRYTVNYAAKIKLIIHSTATEIEPDNQPTWTYSDIQTTRYKKRDRVHYVEAVITDDQNKAYTVEYYQDWKYTGPAQQDRTPNNFTVSYDGGATYNGVNNKVEGIDIGGGKTVDFEFYPHGYAKITTRYTENTDNIVDVLECVKASEWSQLNSTCQEAHIIQTIESKEFEFTFPFNITLLPENSIEEFCHMLKQEINLSIQTMSKPERPTEEEGGDEEEDTGEEYIKQCELNYDYDSGSNSLVFHVDSREVGVGAQLKFVPVDDYHQSEANKFYGILNQGNWELYPNYEYDVMYNNVWNREYFFVHASFMNLIQYNQLGRTGEIYPKPTKLTKYTSSIPDIEFWVSVNGIDPFILIDQDFEIVLALAATLNNADITF